MKKLLTYIAILLLTVVAAGATTISGTLMVCTGLTTELTIDTSGGTWSSSNTSLATVVPGTGVVTGIASGTVVISYNLSGGSFTAVVNVHAQPVAILGANPVCAGSTVMVTNPMGTGTWTSGSPAIATVNLTSGALTAVSPGTTIITYTMFTGCVTTRVQTVNELPSALGGSSAVCVAANVTLTSLPAGGVWSSATPTVATVGSSSGIVAGVVGGGSTISYTLPNGCSRTIAMSVLNLPAAMSGAIITCVGSTTNLGSTTTGGTWSSSNPSVATAGSSGVVTGLTIGTTIVSYLVSSGCSRTAVVTVNTAVAPVAGDSIICLGNAILLSNTDGGGTWSSSNTARATVNISTGVVYGASLGTAIISYRIGAGCYSIRQVTMNSTLASITGSGPICMGTPATFGHPMPGGTWSSSNTGIVTIGAASGVATGVAIGNAYLTYTISSGCWRVLYVSVLGAPAAVTGNAGVCVGGTTSLATTTGGGTWSSSNTTTATVISGSGTVTGIAAGLATISYRVYTGCYALRVVTVSAVPAVITGTAAFCAGTTTVLSSAPAGGVWTSSVIYVARPDSVTGVVTGVAGGNATITYTVGTGCRRTAIVTVGAIPSAITGTLTICAGSTTALTSATTGSTWSSADPGVATVSSGGVVTGIATGSAAISYTNSGGCARVAVVTVNAALTANTGSPIVCVGQTSALSNGTGGGTWTSSTTAKATVNGATGVVTGVSTGTSNITYTALPGCYSVTQVTVNTVPAAITGIASVCIGATTTLSHAVSGGTWSSSNIGKATVDMGGVVTGVANGTVTLTYSLTPGCYRTIIISVIPLPAAISGAAGVCIGKTTTLVNASGGGTWSSCCPAVAGIGSTGVVTGVTEGTAYITYAVTSTGCFVTKVVTVNPNPNISVVSGVSAYPFVCTGVATTFGGYIGSTLQSGTWVSSNSTAAPIGSSSGIVTGMTVGTSNITFTMPTGCRATMIATVAAMPSAITGTLSLCSGATTDLNSATSAGIWTSDNLSVATIDASTGMVSGFDAGTANVYYTVGACYQTAVATVNPLPDAGSIDGPSSVDAGSAIMLTDTVTGGTWLSSDDAIATVGSTGMVTGVVAGSVTIYYILSNDCGVDTAFKSIIVREAPLPCPQAWATVGGTAASAGTGPYVAIAVDNSGVPYIAYEDYTNGYRATVKKWNGSNWVIVGGESVSSGLATDISIAIDGSGDPYVAYLDNDLANKANVRKLSGGSWITVGSGPVSAGTADNMTIAIDSSGDPYIAYRDAANSSRATVRKYSAGSWATVGGAAISTGTAYFNAIAIDASGDPYVVFTDVDNSSRAATKKFTGGSWVNVGGGFASSATAEYTTIAIDASGDPYVAYRDVTNSGRAVVKKLVGGSWVPVGSAASSGAATYTSVAVDGSGNVYVAFIDADNSTRATVKKFTGGSWTLVGAAPASAGNANFLCMAIDAGDNPFVAFMDQANSNKATVKEFTSPAVVGSLSVSTGAATTLVATVEDGTWSSSNTDVATIGTSGIVAGVSEGTAIISYTILDCATTVVVTVTPMDLRPGANTPDRILSEFSIFPNPTSGSLSIASSLSGTAKLLTIDGRELEKYAIASGNTPLVLPANLATGIYLLRFYGADGSTKMVRLVYEP